MRLRSCTFEIVELGYTDGILRLALVGELDLAVSEILVRRLAALREAGVPARLDLSRIEFIDSTGIQALLRGVVHAQVDGTRLIEIDPNVSPQVRRLVDLVGIAQVLWPAHT
ncbi:MAG: STAS domain-containing protein [Solirubrobacteraceae bacterium]